MIALKKLSVYVTTIALGIPVITTADQVTLECKLYIASDLSSTTISGMELKNAALNLESLRQAGFCLFADGKIAEKQWVSANSHAADGSHGTLLGISVYTLENGDAIHAKYEGSYSSTGLKGDYVILGGVGKYEGAKGSGTITGTQSPWETSSVVQIRLDVTTP